MMNPMNFSDKKLVELTKSFITDRDAYDGISYDTAPIIPNNILLFTRTALRTQDYKNTGHHRHVLIFFIKTPGLLCVDEHHYQVKAGQALLIRPFQQHYYAPPPKSILWLFISFDLPRTSEIKPFHQPALVSEFMQETLLKLLQAYRSGRVHETAMFLSLILYELGSSPRPSPVDLDPGQKIIADTNAYIHQHLSEPFTLDALAKHCSMSSSYLRMRFRKTMGISLGHYIHSIRLNHAIKLLVQTNLTVSEIAYQSGFSTPAIFCRAFKKETGNSALKFRKLKK